MVSKLQDNNHGEFHISIKPISLNFTNKPILWHICVHVTVLDGTTVTLKNKDGNMTVTTIINTITDIQRDGKLLIYS